MAMYPDSNASPMSSQTMQQHANPPLGTTPAAIVTRDLVRQVREAFKRKLSATDKMIERDARQVLREQIRARAADADALGAALGAAGALDADVAG